MQYGTRCVKSQIWGRHDETLYIPVKVLQEQQGWTALKFVRATGGELRAAGGGSTLVLSQTAKPVNFAYLIFDDRNDLTRSSSSASRSTAIGHYFALLRAALRFGRELSKHHGIPTSDEDVFLFSRPDVIFSRAVNVPKLAEAFAREGGFAISGAAPPSRDVVEKSPADASALFLAASRSVAEETFLGTSSALFSPPGAPAGEKPSHFSSGKSSPGRDTATQCDVKFLPGKNVVVTTTFFPGRNLTSAYEFSAEEDGQHLTAAFLYGRQLRGLLNRESSDLKNPRRSSGSLGNLLKRAIPVYAFSASSPLLLCSHLVNDDALRGTTRSTSELPNLPTPNSEVDKFPVDVLDARVLVC